MNKKFYGRHHEFVDPNKISVCQRIADVTDMNYIIPIIFTNFGNQNIKTGGVDDHM